MWSKRSTKPTHGQTWCIAVDTSRYARGCIPNTSCSWWVVFPWQCACAQHQWASFFWIWIDFIAKRILKTFNLLSCRFHAQIFSTGLWSFTSYSVPVFLGASGLFLAPAEARNSQMFLSQLNLPEVSCACAGDQTWTCTVFVTGQSRHASGDHINSAPLVYPASPRAWKAISAPVGVPTCISCSVCVPFPGSLYENITSLLWGVCVGHQDSLFHGCYSILFHYLSDTPAPWFIQSETDVYPSISFSVFPPGSNIRRSKNVSQGNLRHFRARR